ncbi:type II CAAX endopeptidase family protein [Pseudonocardia sp. NPDC049635]|uniref:CPBP family intramembrane glutamic endopeptidase n=1 Tax=Pseudonocardia sp. NPDC049635 TaxID=3155506 RepID=UPI00340C85B3
MAHSTAGSTAGARVRRVALPTAGIVALVFAGAYLWVGVSRLTRFEDSGWQAQAIGNLVAFLPPLIVLWLWLRFREGRGLADLGFRVPRPAVGVLTGVLAAVVLFFVMQVLVSVLAPAPAGAGDEAGPLLPGGLAVPVLLVAVAVQASTEEILFRGYLLQAVRRDLGTYGAVLFTAVVFGLCHSLNPGVTAAYVVSTAALGLLLGFLALGRGGLWVACAFHTVWNLIPALVAAGSGPGEGADGPGPNAGWVTAGVLLVFAALAAGLHHRRRSTAAAPAV